MDDVWMTQFLGLCHEIEQRLRAALHAVKGMNAVGESFLALQVRVTQLVVLINRLRTNIHEFFTNTVHVLDHWDGY